MTETIEPTTDAPGSSQQTPTSKKRAGGLNSMLLADLKAMAAGLGVPGASSMKKAQLVEAIKAAQGGARTAGDRGRPAESPTERGRRSRTESGERRTEKAEPRTEKAEPRTEKAEPRTEKAEPRTEK
ncbi:MAG TPA: Rho termination factor N-terminal domain-containing protein, partial [Nocardioides sp.]|uniref:Rho termination factor N-terminal domain-containing protein n=1 Tax=Nocardioides sp. TaxID=35761 RepID=UPI002C0B1347